MTQTIAELMAQFPHAGRVEWIGVRPARGAAMVEQKKVAIEMNGLAGDRRVLAKAKPGKRAVTFIQAEHIATISALARLDGLKPHQLRRNIVVSGINVLALRGQIFRVGSALLKGTTVCAPCSKMEDQLGTGVYNAMRGHGGLCAEVIEPGSCAVGNELHFIKGG